MKEEITGYLRTETGAEYHARHKRQKIREGIAQTLYRFEYNGWDKLDAGGRVMWLARADAVMNKEHSQGVVIRGESLGGSHPHLAEYFMVESLIE